MASVDPQERSKELARRKRERIIILVSLILVVALTYLETQAVNLGGGVPLASSILVFALINLNALLLLFVIFLVFRNLVKLMVERKRGLLGSRLRTKLVVTFVLLSLAPAMIMFFAAFQFVGASIEYWFSAKVERSLYDALEMAESYNQRFKSGAEHLTGLVAGNLAASNVSLRGPSTELNDFLEQRRKAYDLAAVRVFDPKMNELAFITQSGTHKNHLQSFHLDLVSRVLKDKKPLSIMRSVPTGDYAAAVRPIFRQRRLVGAVAGFMLLPPKSLVRTQAVQEGLEGYRQLKAVRQPIRTNQYITLVIVTLLIIFGATWFGFFLAKNITIPIQELAQGTQRIAGGDYDFFINWEGPDEIGTLVNAFNRMTADLKTSTARLAEAQREMQRTNRELEQRRRYMETVFNNVAAGVVAVDPQGVITTFNPSAERMINVPAQVVLGRKWREILSNEHLKVIERLLSGALPGGRKVVNQQVRLNIGGEPLNLMVHISLLQDESGKDLGMVAVFEDLTDMEKAQRMRAWREVARRIAHEVKNPLTPIKLSAQRLTRRYKDRLQDDSGIFDECTRTIVRQVEELQRLVNEFSTFARLPSSRLAPGDLGLICEEAIALFKTGHPDISFVLERESDIPVFNLDREQMSRVLINLLDNAVAAVQQSEEPWQVVVRLSFDEFLKIVRLEVEDSGPGVAPENRLRLFEPYFSTKKGGTGLGLAIVSTIVADHHGYIRVQDNQPRGTRIIIELPAGPRSGGNLEPA